MTKHNDRVIEALNRYIEMEQAPNYAIMLNGEWGCGKTHFVRKKWLEQLNNPEKYSIIKVSLFGLKNIEELKELISQDKVLLEEFINRNRNVGKWLSKSKELKDTNAAQGVIEIGKKVLQRNIGVDVNDIIKIFTRDWLGEVDTGGTTKVLVLDDLERAKMDVNEIFGFISSYIETTSLRVVLVGNEEEITTNDNYRRIKEKLIGDTYKVEVDIDDALNTFVSEVGYLPNEETKILEVLKESMTRLKICNLRVARLSLIKLKALNDEIKSIKAYSDYEYDTITICGKERKKEKYIEEIMFYFLLINVQKAMGKLEKEDITKVKQAFNTGLTVEKYLEMKEKEKEEKLKSGKQELDIDWDNINLGGNGFTPLTEEIEYQFWWSYIWDGELDKDLLKKVVELEMTSLVPKKIMENDTLLKLHAGYWIYEQEEFYKLQSRLIVELNEGRYTDINAIVAAYAMLVHLSDEKVNLLKGIEDIDDFFDAIIARITLTLPSDERNSRLYYMGIDLMVYRGYQLYYSEDKPRIVEFLEKVKKAFKEDDNASLKENFIMIANEVIEDIRKADKFFDELTWRGSQNEPKRYSNVPALEWLGIDKLWSILQGTTLEQQRDFVSVLNDRYSLNSIGAEETYLVFKPELSVNEELVKRYEKKYSDARQTGDNKVTMYSYLVGDVKRTFGGLKVKIEKGEGVRL